MDFVAKTLIQVIRIANIGQALEVVPITMLDGWILIAKALVENVAKILMAMILIVIIGLDLAIVPKLMSLG